jgi:putative transposase
LKKHERTGRPLGEDGFVETLETVLNRKLKRRKPGPKKKRDK